MNAIGPWFNAPPQDLLRIARNYNSSALASVWKAIGSKKKLLDFIRTMITSPEDVLNEWFESEFVKAPLARLAAEIGAPPSQKRYYLRDDDDGDASLPRGGSPSWWYRRTN